MTLSILSASLNLQLACQSGRSAGALAGLVLIAVAAPAGAGPTGWAHQAAGFQNNGAVTVKSLAGGSYAGTQNPTGAVAKANQSAATQAPTVIIQATGSGTRQCVPLLNSSMSGASAAPSCPGGYSSIFTSSGSGGSCPASSTYNIAGTSWSFVRGGAYNNAGVIYVAWVRDSVSTAIQSGSSVILNDTNAQAVCNNSGSFNPSYSANLCCQ